MKILLKYVIFGLFIQLATAKLANFVTPCSAVDPQLNECVVKQANAFFPSLVKGVKEFEILPLDPMEVQLMHLNEEQSGKLGIDLALNLTDAKHYGMKEMKFVSAKVDLKNYHFEVTMTTPRYEVIGDYQVSGRVLVLPIVGQGWANLTFGDMLTHLSFDGQPEQRNGKTFLKLSNVEVSFSIPKIFVRLDNLFGKKDLSDAMNKFLNDNALEAFEELKPALNDVFSVLYAELLGRLFNKIPYNHMFNNLD